MEPVAFGDSDGIENSVRQLRQKIEEKGEVSFFYIPSLPAKKSKLTQDKTSHDNVTIKKHKKSDPSESENSPELLICREIITVKDKRNISVNLNLTDDELAQSTERAKIDRVVQPEHIAYNINDTSTDVTAKLHSQEMLVKAKLPSPENLAKTNVPSPEALPTSEAEAKDGRDAKESPLCSTSSLPNNFPSDAKTDSNGFQGSSSEAHGAQTLEGKISEEKKDVTMESSESDCSKLTHVGENSVCDLPHYMHVSKDVSSSNSSKKVEDIRNTTVSSSAVPTKDMVANEKQPPKSPSTFNSTSASQKECTSERQKYSLRTARQQPIRYVNMDSTQVRHKVAKTPRRRTIKITLPSLSSPAENSLLVIFNELARYHGCEVTIDGKIVDFTKMQILTTGVGTGQQQRGVPAMFTRDFARSQKGSTAHLNRQVPTTSSVEKKLQLRNSLSKQGYLERVQANLQSLGSRLELSTNAGQNSLKEVENPQISNPNAILDTSSTPNSEQMMECRDVLVSVNIA